jgi:hypothetical protein
MINPNILKVFRVYSTERSGHHSVCYWLAQQNKNLTEFIVPKTDNQKKAYDFYLFQNDKYTCGLFDNIGLEHKSLYSNQIYSKHNITQINRIIIAHERGSCQELKSLVFEDMRFARLGQRFVEIDIIVLRDFYNTVASTVKFRPYHPSDLGCHTWGDRAREILGITKNLMNPYFINFNRYNSEKEYRKKICKDLYLDFTDIGVDYLAPQGGGSSFTKHDKKQFDRSQLNYRYRSMLDNRKFMTTIEKYPQYRYLSHKIFGDPGVLSS